MDSNNQSSQIVPPSPEVTAVKLALRGMMNGVAARSMREKGLAYGLIFGVDLPRLLDYAHQLPHTPKLAAELWATDIRECRLLALLLQPPELMSSTQVVEWLQGLRYPEEAEYAAMFLFSKRPDAYSLALTCVESKSLPICQVCGWNLLGRLAPSSNSNLATTSELAFPQDAYNQAKCSPNTPVRLAAGRALTKWTAES